jgi:hypothetical protein
MNVLEHLRSMWAEKAKRTTKLIVSSISHEGREGSLENGSWAFKVPYAFRDALDIKYEERQKDKMSYMVWTQGPILSFKEGDLIQAKDGNSSVQVRFAERMGWDVSKAEMYEGSVVYAMYDLSGGPYTKLGEHSCTQMQFLELLIFGR